MVIRRIREHVTAHNWFAVAVDLVIVVIGVFLGAQATIWNDARQSREQGVEYRARMATEIEYNQRQFEQQMSYFRQVRSHALAALEALDRPAPTLGRQFLVDAYQATQIDNTPPKRFVFDEMVSTGLLGELGDERLREAASDYYAQLPGEPPSGDTASYREILRREMPYPVQIAIRTRCGDREVKINGRTIGTALPSHCPVVLADAAVRASVDHLRSIPELKTALSRYIAGIDQKLDLLEFGQRQSAALRNSLG